MTVSFRWRLLGVSSAIVAAVIAAVMALAWTSLERVERERFDMRLCLEARRLATQPFRPGEGGPVEADLRGKLRLPASFGLMAVAEPADGAEGIRIPRDGAVPDIDALAWSPAPGREGSAPPPPNPPSEGRRHREDRPPRATCSLASFGHGGETWRAAVVNAPSGRGFLAARADAATGELEDALKGALARVVPIALALVALGAWLLSSIAMRPLSRLRESMRAVTPSALGQRLREAGEDREFRELIGAYNGMLERLETSFGQATRFSADAAHELKTPLTILQGRIELALRRTQDPVLQADLTDMLDEVGRLAAITRKLLLLSQADAGRLALHRSRVDLSGMLEALAADAQLLVEGLRITSAIEPGLSVEGDPLLLGQMFNNLVSNAARYCTPEGGVSIAAGRTPAGVEVTFTNASRPIAPADRARFFDRFYRLDPARTRRAEGSGLGLSIAREIARAHGGDLALEPTADDVVKLRVRLPAG